MIGIDEFFEILTEVCDELPAEFFRELHGGVVLSEEVKISPHSRNNDLVIMGEYTASRYGNQITIYYGSFGRSYSFQDRGFIKDRIREVVRHEFRHHMESLGSIHNSSSLEAEDARRKQAYLERHRGE